MQSLRAGVGLAVDWIRIEAAEHQSDGLLGNDKMTIRQEFFFFSSFVLSFTMGSQSGSESIVLSAGDKEGAQG